MFFELLTFLLQLNSVVASNGDGTYGGEYRAEKAGNYQLEVEVNGEQVKDSPFAVAVSAAELRLVYFHLEYDLQHYIYIFFVIYY